MAGGRTPGSTGLGGKDVHAAVGPVGSLKDRPSLGANQVSRIIVVYDPTTSRGRLFALGGDGSTALEADVVVGGGHTTPTGVFHASYWGKDHVSTKYGSFANTPWSRASFGWNAFGPYQLHIRELENRGIYIHGTIGPSWNPFTTLNSLLSPTSHGCVRMSNHDDIRLHELLPSPAGTTVTISADQADVPKPKAKP